ncbi:TIGR02679 family protein [Ramlibacter sp. AN1133]|uniref:TIGR02679 family protein n=1 Tax=Ramlibacter sp. AN1133 TaxID=3133429 RepID=UPI0030C08B63
MTRLLGGEALAGLRQRLRRRYEQGLAVGDTGTLRLSGLNETEHAALAALLGRPARQRSSVQIELAAVDRALDAAGIAPTLRVALELLDGPITDRAAQRERIQEGWQGVARSCDAPLRGWIEQPHGLGLVKRLSRQDTDVATILCRAAAAVLQRLPAQGIPRAQLAAQALGDAHALDDGRPVAALVIAVLRQRAGEAKVVVSDADDTATERRRDTWAGAGVLVNELARPALCLNLPGAAPAGQPAYLSLRSLVRTPVAWPVRARDIHVCENPNLLAIAADSLGARCAPLVCTEGMPGAAQRTLLRQLAEVGARLHYHGDFDWPGLAIANHVLRAFGARPWRFTAADYLACLPAATRPGSVLTGDRVTACWDSTLTATMEQHRVAIPEEAVADTLLPDLVPRA